MSLLFSTTAVPFYIPISNVKIFNFFTSLSTLIFCFMFVCLFFDNSHCNGLQVISYCGFGFRFPNVVEHLLMYFLDICISPSETCLFKSFGHFLIEYFFSFWVIRVLYKYSILILFQICELQIFSSIFWLPFYFVDIILWCRKLLKFLQNLINLNFIFIVFAYTFGVLSKKPLPSPKPLSFLSVLGLMFSFWCILS